MWEITQFRKRLRTLRLNLNSNEQDVALHAKIDVQRYLDIADGIVAPTLAEICAMAKFFNVTPEYLMFEDEDSVEIEVITIKGDAFKVGRNILPKKRINKELLDGKNPEDFVLFKITDELMSPPFYKNDYALLEATRNIRSESVGTIINHKGLPVLRNLIETDEMIIVFCSQIDEEKMIYYTNKEELRRFGTSYKMITLKTYIN